MRSFLRIVWGVLGVLLGAMAGFVVGFLGAFGVAWKHPEHDFSQVLVGIPIIGALIGGVACHLLFFGGSWQDREVLPPPSEEDGEADDSR